MDKIQANKNLFKKVVLKKIEELLQKSINNNEKEMSVESEGTTSCDILEESIGTINIRHDSIHNSLLCEEAKPGVQRRFIHRKNNMRDSLGYDAEDYEKMDKTQKIEYVEYKLSSSAQSQSVETPTQHSIFCCK